MSNRSFLALCSVIIGGFFLFGVLHSEPPWDLRSIYKRWIERPDRVQWPQQVPAKAPVERVSTYRPNYSQILNYVVTPDAVYASVRAGFKSAIIGWKKDGTLLWDRTLYDGNGKTRTNYMQFGMLFIVAGPHLVISGDNVGQGGKKSLLWIDRKTGKTTAILPVGGTSALAYYPKGRIIIAVVSVPDPVLTNGRQLGRMDVVAYSTDRREVWRRRLPTPDTKPLRVDGDAIIVTNIPHYPPHDRPANSGAAYIKRLDPATGNDLWSVDPTFDASATQPQSTQQNAVNLPRNEEAFSIALREHVLIYNSATGKNVWRLQTPEDFIGLPVLLKGDSEHLYLIYDSPRTAPPPGALSYPSAQLAWSDASVQTTHTRPIMWGNRVVYEVWPPNTPPTGLQPIPRLYIRSPQGTYLFTEQQFALRGHGPPQVHGDLLYLVDGYNIVALRWTGK